MIRYTTEIDLKAQEVRVIFGKESNTFAFESSERFRVEDAMMLSAEFMTRRLRDLLQALINRADNPTTIEELVLAGATAQVNAMPAEAERLALIQDLYNEGVHG
jgi:hypothetical protein